MITLLMWFIVRTKKIAFIAPILLCSCNDKVNEKAHSRDLRENSVITKPFHKISNKIWSHEIQGISNYTIFLDFENELFKVDTLADVDVLAFSFKLLNDSAYFVINYPFVGKFECCDKVSKYEAVNEIIKNGVVNKYGIVKNTKLNFRVIQNRDIKIVYNNCPEEKLKLFNKIMDSVYEKLISASIGAQ